MFSREKLEVHIDMQPLQVLFKTVGSVTVFNAFVPLDHAALPDNQNIAKIAVIIRSAKGISLLLL